MILAVTPISRKGMKAMRTAIGMVITGMRALGMCQRKRTMTRATVIMISIRVDVRLSMERVINSPRS